MPFQHLTILWFHELPPHVWGPAVIVLLGTIDQIQVKVVTEAEANQPEMK